MEIIALKNSKLISVNSFSEINSHNLFAIEVLNLSKFPITVVEVGFFVSGNAQRMSIPNPILGDQGTWPRQLKSRDLTTVYLELSEILLSPYRKKINCAFVITSCGHIQKGKSEALKQLIKFKRHE